MTEHAMASRTPGHAAPKFDSIELLRFVAATSVLFVHIPTIGAGYFGVDIFFVISGFVMMLSTEASAKSFLLKRAIRILPIYYALTIGVFLIAMWHPSLLANTTADLSHLVKSLLFIPFDKNGIGHYPILFLGWTLNYEMYFYVIFWAALMISRSHRALISTVALVTIYLLCKGNRSLPLAAYGNSIALEFALGMLVYEFVVKKDAVKSIQICVPLLLVALTSAGFSESRFFQLGILSSLFVALTLVVLKRVEIPRIVTLLGGSSYALYLTHPYIIQVFDKSTRWFSGTSLQAAAAIVLALLLCNVAAIAIFVYLESPLLAYLRGAILGRRETAVAMA